MTSRFLLAILLTGAGAALGGCHQQASGPGDKPAEVLSGTISDAMLPYDTVTSQPPLDPRAARSARSGAEPDAEATGDAPAAPATAAPAAPAGPAPAPAAAE